jgi:autotransporter-associated beta strand protein
MKTLVLAAIRCSLMFLVPSVTYAISTQWDLDPISGDWNTAANWTPMGVPNGPADTATFGLSKTTNVSISEDTEVNDLVFTPAATNPYSVTVRSGLTLTISGTGITNNSGTEQVFFTGSDNFDDSGQIRFTNSSTAGNSSIFNIGRGSSISFFDRSTAGSASIHFPDDEGSSISFFDRSTAGNSSIEVVEGAGGRTRILFADHSSAGNSTITTFNHSRLSFLDNSTAGSASIFVDDVSFLDFVGNSSAGNASIFVAGTNGYFGEVSFYGSSTAGNATLGGAGAYYFYGSSRGGTAQIELFQIFPGWVSGMLDISRHDALGVTIGSLAGVEGTLVALGANNLTVGSNNLSTTFSGMIQDGGLNGGTGGSLTKIGTGTLHLTGANTYTGNTNVNRGVLQVDGSITSDTFVNHRGTLAGRGTINGNVMNSGKVSPGDSPGMLTVVHNYTQAQYATLMIQIAGTSTGQFSVLNVLGNANLNGFLDPVLLNGFVPDIGDSFIFLNYASFTGEFSHIKHRLFDHGTLQWSLTYENTYAMLTVEPHRPGVPDQGSTFLLLVLGLLGLVTYRRELLRGQP